VTPDYWLVLGASCPDCGEYETVDVCATREDADMCAAEHKERNTWRSHLEIVDGTFWKAEA
jgi:hypothetical protein